MMIKRLKILALLPFVLLPLLAASCVKQAAPEPAIAPQVQQPALVVSYKGEQGKNALALLKANYKTETKIYKGIGEFVTSINGQVPDKDHFWAFYVNGQSSQVGASAYITKPSDNIEWKLEQVNSNSQ